MKVTQGTTQTLPAGIDFPSRNIHEGHVQAHHPSAPALAVVMREAEAKRERKASRKAAAIKCALVS